MTDSPLHGDLLQVVKLAHDLAFYRTISDGEIRREMGEAAWIELSDAVAHLPEAERVLPEPPRGLAGRWWAWKMERALRRP